jgi:nucleoside-diphosphate-sugar epimerase
VRRALVTGATGQVGAYLVERLAADGWHVRALVRAPVTAAWLEPLGATLIGGDIMDRARLAAAAEECDAIFHAAALITSEGDWPLFDAANVEGTRNAIAAAESSRARLVHVSSVAVYGGAARYRSTPTDEDTPLAPLTEGAFYARSKREADLLVLNAHAAGRIWGCAVRPDVIYGRYDRQFVPRAARIMKRGYFPVFGGGRAVMAIVHAAAVADGAVRAVETEVAGGRAYNLANDYDVTVSDFVRLAAIGLGRHVMRLPVPLALARAGFHGAAAGLRFAKREALGRDLLSALDFMSRDNPFSSERARRELGWAPAVRPEAGIPEAFRWWKEHRRRAGGAT